MHSNSDFYALKKLLSRHTNRAYFVGGFVRDEILGIKTKDIDIEIYDISSEKFDEIMHELGASGVGKSFFVYKFGHFDLSLPRVESKIGRGHSAFAVEICDDEKLASKRRDFTINSVMKNIFTGEILDFYGGISDLSNKTLRIVDEMSFADDSLRVLRAVQFVARFGLKIDAKSLKIMREIDLSDLSVGRITDELKKLFTAKHQELGLKAIYDLGLAKFLFGKEITLDQSLALQKRLKMGTKFVKNEMYFLYLLLNFLNLDKLAVLKRLNLNSAYKKILTEPYFTDVTARNLLEVSLKMPLCDWLGLDSEKLQNFAKKNGIYDKKLKTDANAQKIVAAGFKNEEIAAEIERQNAKFIENFIKTQGL